MWVVYAKSMKQLVFAYLLLCVSDVATALDIYRWKNDEGHFVYSDTPLEGAEKVEIGEIMVVPAHPLPTSSERATVKLAAVPYKSLEITNPADEQTLRDNSNPSVSVVVSVKPRLQTKFGHELQLLFDGDEFGAPVSSLRFTLDAVERGSHSLQALVVESDGRIFERSPISTFFIHKQSVSNRAP